MKKERKINKIPVVALSTFGHCAEDWLHCLIDSHKEVLILPGSTFFRKIDELKKKNFYLENTLKPNAIVDIIGNVDFFNEKRDSKNPVLQKNQNKLTFIKYIINFLAAEKELVCEKRLFFAIHYAYAKINKINLNNIKVIVAHEQTPWNCYQYIEHFNSKFIFMVRDPRAVVAGILRRYKRYPKIPINFPLDINLSFMLAAQEFYQKMKKKRILILKNEDMHSNLKSEMKKFCKWVNIRFNKSLLNPTRVGKKWLGESSYLAKGDLKKEAPKNYYKPINIEARWRNFLDKNTILITEAVYEKIMIQNKYKFDNKLNFISKSLGYLGAVFKFQPYNNPFSFIKLFIFKNVIRRIFIIFFNKQSRKIFDIL
jgi:hypothetical protein